MTNVKRVGFVTKLLYGVIVVKADKSSATRRRRVVRLSGDGLPQEKTGGHVRNRRINQGIVAATVVVCAASGLGAPSNADDGGDDSLERAQRAEQRRASHPKSTRLTARHGAQTRMPAST